MNPEQYCHEKVVNSGSNFTGAFALLSNDRRLSIEAIYAFCREIDDIVDECSDMALAKVKLSWWKNEVEKNFDSSSNHPVLRALSSPIKKYSLQKTDFLEIIDGVAMDTNHEPFKDWNDLDIYCDKVAGAVGRLSSRVFGGVDDQIIQYASILGRACQYTNIIRDIAEDLRKNRCYLPITLLKKYEINSSQQIFENNLKFTNMCSEMAKINHGLYNLAFKILPKEKYKEQRAGIVMGVVYRTLLRKIEHSNFNVKERKVSLHPFKKFWSAWYASWGSIPS